MDQCRFPGLEKAARRLDSRKKGLSLDELRSLLCHDCDFYDDEHDDDLECSCFQVLAVLLERKVLTPQGLSDAVNERTVGEE